MVRVPLLAIDPFSPDDDSADHAGNRTEYGQRAKNPEQPVNWRWHQQQECTDSSAGNRG